jgi:hypothetical protein
MITSRLIIFNEDVAQTVYVGGFLGTSFLKSELSRIGLCNSGLDKKFNKLGRSRICMWGRERAMRRPNLVA